MINLESSYKTLELKRDFRRIESFIINFQVMELVKNRVVVEDYNNFYIEGLVPIGEGTRISTGVVIKGTSKIGSNVALYPNAYIENSIIGDNCVVLPGSIVRDSTLENDVQIGPYTHLRNGALVKEGAKLGNFVEMKKSILGKGSKSMHLTYLGDTEVGEKVNIGAGTITCNYDGVTKNKTIIEDNVFIGSGTELVAPVVIRKNSYVGAGSTITEEVPENSLGIARQRQENKVDWVKQKGNRVKT
jgi:bifunctional UDP-N-acetylglucosamine pyrophosphorylase/glucosamine-1-phosphate N-acetyltransferase